MEVGLDEAVRSKLMELMQALSRRKPRVGAVSGLGPLGGAGGGSPGGSKRGQIETGKGKWKGPVTGDKRPRDDKPTCSERVLRPRKGTKGRERELSVARILVWRAEVLT